LEARARHPQREARDLILTGNFLIYELNCDFNETGELFANIAIAEEHLGMLGRPAVVVGARVAYIRTDTRGSRRAKTLRDPAFWQCPMAITDSEGKTTVSYQWVTGPGLDDGVAVLRKTGNNLRGDFARFSDQGNRSGKIHFRLLNNFSEAEGFDPTTPKAQVVINKLISRFEQLKSANNSALAA